KTPAATAREPKGLEDLSGRFGSPLAVGPHFLARAHAGIPLNHNFTHSVGSGGPGLHPTTAPVPSGRCRCRGGTRELDAEPRASGGAGRAMVPIAMRRRASPPSIRARRPRALAAGLLVAALAAGAAPLRAQPVLHEFIERFGQDDSVFAP